MHKNVIQYIERSDAIPSAPQIVTRLVEITRDDGYRVADVIQLLSTDAGLAGDILRLANSPLFGVTRRISSLTHATNLLGIRRVMSLVMGRCMVDGVSAGRTGPIDVSYYWRRSLATGVLSARFADQIIPRCREEAFMSGLLSDVGVFVLSRAMPQAYEPAALAYGPKRGAELLDIEQHCVNAIHPEASALVLERWSLPEVMVEAVRHHHCHEAPDGLPDGAAELASCIHGASEVARLLCEAPKADEILPICEASVAVVGLNLGVLEHVLRDIESDIEEFAGILHIDVIPSRVYDIIAASIADRLATV